MNLARLSIEKSRITWVLLTGVVLTGLATYGSLARDSMPPYTVRVATVITRFPGASPERVEQLVTDKVEKVAQELPELKEVSSTSRTGLSVVSVKLRDEVAPEELQAVWDRLRRKLDQMDGLPEGVTPQVNDDGIGEVFGMVVGLTSDGFSYAEMKVFADDLRDDLIKLSNAAKVELRGVQEERVFVEFDNARLREYNLTASMLQGVLASTNILGSGGAVNVEDERIILEPTGNFDDLQSIRSVLIPVGGGQVVQLEDIASVRQSYVDPPTQLVRTTGGPSPRSSSSPSASRGHGPRAYRARTSRRPSGPSWTASRPESIARTTSRSRSSCAAMRASSRPWHRSRRWTSSRRARGRACRCYRSRTWFPSGSTPRSSAWI